MGSYSHILVVDDNDAVRQVLRAVLQAAGYRVACAANGRDALDYLRAAEPPFVILLDLAMPVMDGRQFRQHQQADPTLALIPVVVVSGEGDLPQIAASLGVAGHFSKPVEPAKLVEAIRVMDRDGSLIPMVAPC
jgi:CheY-like chemotaxis protein